MTHDRFLTISPSTISLDQSFIDSKIILVRDHMPHVTDIHLNANNGFFKNTIIDLFNTADIDYREKIFVFDSYMCFDDFAVEQSVFTNEWLFEKAVREFIDMLPDWTTVPRTTPTKNLSAMMNKVRPNRLLTSMILANMFDRKDIRYSFNSIGLANPELVLQELLLDCDYNFDTSKLMIDRWVGPREFNSNAQIFFRFLYKSIFSYSTVSLITEPTFFENGTHLSEKTLMSVYAGHFPIWIGSYKAAECAERLGIDVFNDIIDHSYQYIEHPGKRSVEAILKNIELLTNLEMQVDLRNKMYHRLDDNLKLMRDLNKLNNTMRQEFNSHNLDTYDYFSKLHR